MQHADPWERPVRTADYSPSLLERLRSDDLRVNKSEPDPLVDRVESIKANLVRVLNGRAGGAPSAPAFGLEDLNDSVLGSRDLLAAIAADIRRVLTVFEPRIEDVSVRFDRLQAGGHELYFVIQAKTRIREANHQLTIDFLMKEGRRFAVV